MQKLLRLLRIRIAYRKIFCSAPYNTVRNRDLIDTLECPQDLQYAIAMPRSKIYGFNAGMPKRIIQRGHVSLCQVDNVNIISHAGSVRGGIIISKNRKFFKLSSRHLCDIRQQIIGNPADRSPIKPLSCAPIGLK